MAWRTARNEVIDAAGLRTFPSGNGAAGGAFKFVFTNLPGDFDRDNIVSGSDFLIWQAGLGNPSPRFVDGDANGDGMVDSADLDFWNSNYGTNLIDLALAADFDDDYDVDGSDFLEWQSHFGQSVTPGEDGDANGDGFVDALDEAMLDAQYGISLAVLG